MAIENVRVVTLTIEGTEVGARSDETIMEVAEQNRIPIPGLCHLDGLSDIGACRLCLIEIKGQARLQPACVTYVQEGMEITTQSPNLQEYRKLILQMLFTERNHVCAVCVSNGHCGLQYTAKTCGMDHVELPYIFPRLAVDASHDRFVHDPNRCILCTRCVRVCDEIEGAHTWDIMGRGIESRVITDLNQPWGESDTCTGCGKCVQACPTGALVEKGQSVGEMHKNRRFLTYLTVMREVKK